MNQPRRNQGQGRQEHVEPVLTEAEKRLKKELAIVDWQVVSILDFALIGLIMSLFDDDPSRAALEDPDNPVQEDPRYYNIYVWGQSCFSLLLTRKPNETPGFLYLSSEDVEKIQCIKHPGVQTWAIEQLRALARFPDVYKPSYACVPEYIPFVEEEGATMREDVLPLEELSFDGIGAIMERVGRGNHYITEWAKNAFYYLYYSKIWKHQSAKKVLPRIDELGVANIELIMAHFLDEDKESVKKWGTQLLEYVQTHEASLNIKKIGALLLKAIKHDDEGIFSELVTLFGYPALSLSFRYHNKNIYEVDLRSVRLWQMGVDKFRFPERKKHRLVIDKPPESQNPLQQRTICMEEDQVEEDDRSKRIKYLLRNGGGYEDRVFFYDHSEGCDGDTLLHIIMRFGKAKILRCLLEHELCDQSLFDQLCGLSNKNRKKPLDYEGSRVLLNSCLPPMKRGMEDEMMEIRGDIKRIKLVNFDDL